MKDLRSSCLADAETSSWFTVFFTSRMPSVIV